MRARDVLLPILENVEQASPHLERCPKCVRMVAAFPHRPPPAADVVDGPGDAHGEPLYALGQRGGLVRLNDQMKMVHLDAPLDDAKDAIRGGRQRRADDAERARTTQGGKTGGPERHVHGTVDRVDGSSAMRNGTTTRGRFPAGALASTTPGANRKLELLRPPCHLE